MKKLWYFLFIPFLFACGGDNINEELSPIISESGITQEDIFKSTGCKPVEFKNIEVMALIVNEKSSERYLYGSKKTDSGSFFWIAKFTSDGEQIWEIIKTDPFYSTYAFYPCFLSDGKIVVGCVNRLDEREVKKVVPIIIKNDKEYKSVEVPEGFFYTQTVAFKDFFFCNLSQNDLIHYGKQGAIQVSNDGKILNQAEELFFPKSGTVLWNTSTDFISVNESFINKGDIFGGMEKGWAYSLELPDYKTNIIDLSLDKDTVIVTYNLVLKNDKKETYKVKLAYNDGSLLSLEGDGELPSQSYLELGKEYLAPDGLSVTMRNIAIEDNGEGTTYYRIYYTLKNNTKDKVILEGSFEAFHNVMVKPESQYGFFNNLYPGESIDRSYTFKSLSGNRYTFIHYKYKWDSPTSELLKNSPKWSIPKD